MRRYLRDVERFLAADLPHKRIEDVPLLAEIAPTLSVARVIFQRSSGLENGSAIICCIDCVLQHVLYAWGCSNSYFPAVAWVLQQPLRNTTVENIIEMIHTPHRSIAAPSTPAAIYVWSRFHSCAISHFHKLNSKAGGTEPVQPSKDGSLPDLHLNLSFSWMRESQIEISVQLLHLARLSSREALGRIDECAFPLDPRAICACPEMSVELDMAWAAIMNDVNEGDSVVVESTTTTPSLRIWPLEHENQLLLKRRRAPSASTASNGLDTPHELLYRKGDFVRAVCVNALNPCQVAVALNRGVQQLELSETSPTAEHSKDEPGARLQMAARQSAASAEFVAQCLCAHTRLPLFLAGGDSIVQCWQFGQAYQGHGLHDHLRAQYKLPAGGRVVNIHISPLCSEQFGSTCCRLFHCRLLAQLG